MGWDIFYIEGIFEYANWKEMLMIVMIFATSMSKEIHQSEKSQLNEHFHRKDRKLTRVETIFKSLFTVKQNSNYVLSYLFLFSYSYIAVAPRGRWKTCTVTTVLRPHRPWQNFCRSASVHHHSEFEIKAQTFSFNPRGLTKVLHQRFRNYRNFYTQYPIFRGSNVIDKLFHGQVSPIPLIFHDKWSR